ncbi:Tim17/Tim22/Tim23/Pmp24 family-domain-containing protein [Triangularia verruculosa]|uniref:Tim17/Tim22/Tim23/Pmp24 family-domain-containing protein n=1 Tax=Triangularia verruculosa TaxID=2587418 RepID=A0AAN6XG64_9PEZI|nr:Tim17/Tim22/Tim23/Pmp24 family-domain-containing protein [Triangularia verruculosa]
MASHTGGDDDKYKRQDAVSAAVTMGALFGTGGLFLAAVKTSLERKHVGPWAVFSKHGHIAATFAAVGTVYEFSRVASANLREKNDHYNNAIAGAFGGAVLGLKAGRIPAVLGYGALMAVTGAVFEYTGGRFQGFGRDPDVDEYERKEMLRKRYRRPMEETIAEIGEGRSIRPPGYEERRRERLKEAYGFEVKPVSTDPDRV